MGKGPRQTSASPCSQTLGPLPASLPPSAVRDDRRAHLPGGHLKLVRGEYDVTAKDEALEVRGRGCTLVLRSF